MSEKVYTDIEGGVFTVSVDKNCASYHIVKRFIDSINVGRGDYKSECWTSKYTSAMVEHEPFDSGWVYTASIMNDAECNHYAVYYKKLLKKMFDTITSLERCYKLPAYNSNTKDSK